MTCCHHCVKGCTVVVISISSVLSRMFSLLNMTPNGVDTEHVFFTDLNTVANPCVIGMFDV